MTFTTDKLMEYAQEGAKQELELLRAKEARIFELFPSLGGGEAPQKKRQAKASLEVKKSPQAAAAYWTEERRAEVSRRMRAWHARQRRRA